MPYPPLKYLFHLQILDPSLTLPSPFPVNWQCQPFLSVANLQPSLPAAKEHLAGEGLFFHIKDGGHPEIWA